MKSSAKLKTSRSSSHAANGTLASRRNTKCLNRFIRQRQWSVWTPESRNLPRFLMAPYTSQSTASASQRKLAMLQRQLSRKVKFSASWQKQKKKSSVCTHIANIRRDYLHKVTSEISKNHAMIVIEDLKVSNMSKSAKGTAERPGRNIRAKSGLNRSILDQGWYEMRRQLEYKQLWRGGQVLAIPPAYTSQRCACCGHTAKETVKRKVNSCVRYAAIPRTPISTEHVTF